MPLYEYECTTCHRRTEKILKFSDPDLTICPYCSGPLERTLTAPNVQFKGGGWYKDLYSSAKPASNSADSSSPDSAPSSDAKPASDSKSSEPSSSSSGETSKSTNSTPTSSPAPSAPATSSPAPASKP